MKNVKIICSFAVLAFAVCLFSGCATTSTYIDEEEPIPTSIPSSKSKSKQYQKEIVKDYEQIEKGEYTNMQPNPFRDYIIKGVIFVESQVTIDVNGERTGSEITNYMLMKEAEKLGADDVMNVKIDEREESKVIDTYERENDNEVKFVNRKYKKTTFYYTATALAIKYTTAIKDKALLETKSSITINSNNEKKESKNKNKK